MSSAITSRVVPSRSAQRRRQLAAIGGYMSGALGQSLCIPGILFKFAFAAVATLLQVDYKY